MVTYLNDSEKKEDETAMPPEQRMCSMLAGRTGRSLWIFPKQCWMLLQEMKSESQSGPELCIAMSKIDFYFAFYLYEIGKPLENFEQQRNIYGLANKNT